MKYNLVDYGVGVDVYRNDALIGHIDGVSSCDLTEEMIEELLFGDIDEEDCCDW